jgi:ornithine--oxo-acid transaminase
MLEALRSMQSKHIKALRGRGLMIGIDIEPGSGTAKEFCKKLIREGVICKDTHVQTIRIAPPLVISKEDLDLGIERMARVFLS